MTGVRAELFAVRRAAGARRTAGAGPQSGHLSLLGLSLKEWKDAGRERTGVPKKWVPHKPPMRRRHA